MAMPINVTSTSNNMDTLSRNELIHFINEILQLNFTKVEQMCSGDAYCQMLHKLWPKAVALKKVKFGAKQEHIYIGNWKVLQDAFKKLHIDKEVPIQRLVKGRFQDNFEFLQWFYKFYTINDSGENDAYDAVAARSGAGVTTTPAARVPARTKPAANRKAPSAAAVSPVKKSGSSADVKRLEEQVNDLLVAVEGLEKERDFYFNKLRDIEVFCQEKDEDELFHPFVSQILEVLYATEDGFGPAEGEGEREGEEEQQEEEEEEQEEY